MSHLINEKGFAFTLTIFLMLIISILGLALISLTNNEEKSIVSQVRLEKCFYITEGGLERGILRVKEEEYVGSFSEDLGEGDYTVTITDLGNRRYIVDSRGCIDRNGSPIKRGIKAQIEIGRIIPPLFNYSYFINNWGWYWGHDITSNGDIRSNGRFDFVDGPMVNGYIYAGLDIDDHGTPVRGTGGQADHQHPFSEKLEMPNLQNLDYYEQLANDRGGSIKIDGVTLVDKVFGDEPGESGNIVLIGTSSEPIEIDGPVVVTGDVVIKGKITGQGTIYTGRNIYIADDIDYKKAPSSPRPASENPSVVDGWVEAHKDDDLVAFAAKENIVMGDYTKDPHFGYYDSDKWYSNYYLFDMGSEDVGMDGIPDTGDIGEDDGIFNPSYEDLDGDGIFDDDYNWSDIQTQEDITNFYNVPIDVTEFGDLASLDTNKVEGVFYTNHAFAGRTGNGIHMNGAIVSKDEAIVYRNTITFNYDERINTRYVTDPNRFVDLGLPTVETAVILSWQEVKQ